MKNGNIIFSQDRKYRYLLERIFEDRHYSEEPHELTVNFCMLNPSTADEIQNDPTVTRCINLSLIHI